MKPLAILLREYDAAIEKHPDFPSGMAAVSVIAEELGELAKELNDAAEGSEGAYDRAIIEAAHVAVTAIRTMEAISPLTNK